ncbi:hypothetical protein QTP88_015577 [Uroleucon formosanum]
MPVNNKTNSKPSGRPPVDNFILCSERTQRRKIQSLLSSSCITSPEVLSAAKSKLYKKGQRSAASLFKDSSSSPNRAKKIKSAYKDANKNCPVPYTPDEALAFMIDNKLTKQQYINIRLGSKKRNCDIYPSYENIILEKNNCYPSNIDITESYCKIPLQSLLDHTTNRILKISSICNKNLNAELEMVYKWGCDGSSGQSQYKQKFNDSSTSTDQTMFMFSLVPLELRCFPIRNNDSDIIWQNPVPSSTKFCRPIKFMYKKETTESTQKEVKDIEEQINNVCNTDVLHNDQVVQVKHTLIFSMVDGKVCNSMTGISSQTCYICGCKPKEFNNIDNVINRPSITENYRFGLSTLHAWIRFFEYFLHLAYRLEFKTWQVKAVHKDVFNKRKQFIQNKFRSEMGLLVDVVLQGHGTTNDGNTARKFFRKPEISAACTGINVDLIQRCGNILLAMASGHAINVDYFEEYCLITAKMFVSLYPWYYMPASVHKVLLHGAAVIRFAPLPIGKLSEEAQESRNKEYKVYREHHTRKNSRFNTNEDLMHALLFTSDPYISSLRNTFPKYAQDFSEDIKKLLRPIESNGANETNEDIMIDLNQSLTDINLSD